MRKAIEERMSKRSFEKEPLSKEIQEKIRTMIAERNQKSGLTMEFVEDGSVAFRSFKVTYGMFKNVRSMILMKAKKQDEHGKEKIGYYGEDIILDLTDMGLGTCWVAGTYDKTVFNIEDDEELYAVIVVGKALQPSLKQKIMRSGFSGKKKSVEELLEAISPAPEWVLKGMEAVRLAPSAVNKQKYRFHYDGENLTADVPDDYPTDLIDLGIAKRHFEVEAGGLFDLGNGACFTKF